MLTASELRAIRSYEQLISEHQTKLNAFRLNPEAFDNLGTLAGAQTNAIRQSIIQGRISKLEREIATFIQNIQKIQDGQ